MNNKQMLEIAYRRLKIILNEEDSKELLELAKDIEDESIERALPLTDKETDYLRKKVWNEYIQYKDGRINYYEIKIALKKRINYLKTQKNKLSVLDYKKENIELSTYELFDEQIYRILRKNEIYSLKDLLTIDKESIKNLYSLGEISYKKIIDKVHNELDLIFIDEISVEERNKFLSDEYKNNKEKVLNSNIDWLDFNHAKLKRLKTLGIETIYDLINNFDNVLNKNNDRKRIENYEVIKQIQTDGIIDNRPELLRIKKERLLAKYNYLLQRRSISLANRIEIDKELEKVIRELDSISNKKILKKYRPN